MAISNSTPVIIGVGQVVDHWDGSDAAQAPSPSTLARDAALAALADTGAGGAVAAAIDVLAFVRVNSDSITGVKQPFPQCADLASALAADLGIAPKRRVYSKVGGDQPQALVNEFAAAIFAGEADTVLLAGSEAIAAMKIATRARMKLDWSRKDVGKFDDRGLGAPMLSSYERANGLGFPTQTYPVFEQALKSRLGLDVESYTRMLSELWAGFSEVAATNPYSQFPVARTADFLATPSKENYRVADPYLKWHVAQDAVNQGAAVILTSLGRARALDVPEAKLVYLHGSAEGADRFVTERPDLSRSRSIELVGRRALETAGKTAGEMAEIDLYSCFPCAVLLAAEALQLDWRSRRLTVTGGLPFFGGPGNNYSMHAIATMIERLRMQPGAFGLVLANGGFLSKQAAGVYSTTPRANWQPVDCADLQAELDAQVAPRLLETDGEVAVEAYTVTWRKDVPQRAFVIGSMGEGRVLARVATGHRATCAALAATDPLGRIVRVRREGETNLLAPSDRLGDASEGFFTRRFEHVRVERRGHVLEVTLDRPDQMNALHSAVHFALHEIWDDFARDPELWVAILTGAGERAFSAGNDLKATARGGDQSMPRSGFAGLTARFDRDKPVIAAVNGVAMGGGLEIVLACDLAVADESARFALPEVKVGLFAAAGGVQRLTRQIGRKAAMELILTGRHFDAAEALRLGVINEVVAKGSSMDAARALAERICAVSPSALRASKQALNALDEVDDLERAFAANGPIFGRLMRTKDFREGVTAFAEKRSPQWTNR
jgi:acetyl-CoA C-acetyltransferase